ncbi:hypothetical protein EVAR_9350_1 [Eumeta japonica]|uniref:Uncharacterized protein n=1 Tax=Eumeta variegata TaxID=151549 RepID=A0A4C1YTW0_EUMVA|nr:hypothetical protein EVAR_9350_1 [Eumeta japonica]
MGKGLARFRSFEGKFKFSVRFNGSGCAARSRRRGRGRRSRGIRYIRDKPLSSAWNVFEKGSETIPGRAGRNKCVDYYVSRRRRGRRRCARVGWARILNDVSGPRAPLNSILVIFPPQRAASSKRTPLVIRLTPPMTEASDCARRRRCVLGGGAAELSERAVRLRAPPAPRAPGWGLPLLVSLYTHQQLSLSDVNIYFIALQKLYLLAHEKMMTPCTRSLPSTLRYSRSER